MKGREGVKGWGGEGKEQVKGREGEGRGEGKERGSVWLYHLYVIQYVVLRVYCCLLSRI